MENQTTSADVNAGDKEKEGCSCSFHASTWKKLWNPDCPVHGKPEPAPDDAELKGQNELLGVVQAAYLKHHVGLDNIGWDALGHMMQNALCNAMGDAGFQRWLEENTK